MRGSHLRSMTIAAGAALLLAASAAAESATPPRYDAVAFFTTTTYILPAGRAWSPDDEHSFEDAVTLREGLRMSSNRAAVRCTPALCTHSQWLP